MQKLRTRPAVALAALTALAAAGCDPAPPSVVRMSTADPTADIEPDQVRLPEGDMEEADEEKPLIPPGERRK